MESPWLTPKEAADYCKISLSLFNQLRKKIPIKVGGTVRRPRFHKDELDYWMSNMFTIKEDQEIGRKEEEECLEENSKIGKYPIIVTDKIYKARPLT
jgi:hypothetical protein